MGEGPAQCSAVWLRKDLRVCHLVVLNNEKWVEKTRVESDSFLRGSRRLCCALGAWAAALVRTVLDSGRGSSGGGPSSCFRPVRLEAVNHEEPRVINLYPAVRQQHVNSLNTMWINWDNSSEN